MLTRPSDLDHPPEFLKGPCFNAAIVEARAAYGIHNQGHQASSGDMLKKKWDAIEALDSDQSGTLWAREFNFVPSEDGKRFGRVAILTNVVLALAETGGFPGSPTLRSRFTATSAILEDWLTREWINAGQLVFSNFTDQGQFRPPDQGYNPPGDQGGGQRGGGGPVGTIAG